MGRKKMIIDKSLLPCCEKYRVPSLEEVQEYWSQHPGIACSPEYFYHHYSALGWECNGKRIMYWTSIAEKWRHNGCFATAAGKSANTCSSRPYGYRQTQMTAEERRQRLVAAETAIMEQKQREQAEREARLEEDRKNSVSYEEYVALKALNDES